MKEFCLLDYIYQELQNQAENPWKTESYQKSTDVNLERKAIIDLNMVERGIDVKVVCAINEHAVQFELIIRVICNMLVIEYIA